MESSSKYKPWTKADDAAIRKRYPAKGPAMGAEIGRTPAATQRRASQIGVTLTRKAVAGLMPDRSDLAARYYPYVMTIANRRAARMSGRGARVRQEYRDVATSELVRSAGRFAGINGSQFKHYLTHCVLLSLRDADRSRVNRGPEPLPIHDFDHPVARVEDGPGSLPDFDSMIAGLPEVDREVLTLRFRDGLSQAKIAGRLGITKSGVDGRCRRALERLRAQLVEGGKAGELLREAS